MYRILPVKATLFRQKTRHGSNAKALSAPKRYQAALWARSIPQVVSAGNLNLVFDFDKKKEPSLVVETHPMRKAHLVELSELAELVPEVALLARTAEVPDPHLRSGYVSHGGFICLDLFLRWLSFVVLVVVVQGNGGTA